MQHPAEGAGGRGRGWQAAEPRCLRAASRGRPRPADGRRELPGPPGAGPGPEAQGRAAAACTPPHRCRGSQPEGRQPSAWAFSSPKAALCCLYISNRRKELKTFRGLFPPALKTQISGSLGLCGKHSHLELRAALVHFRLQPSVPEKIHLVRSHIGSLENTTSKV